MQASHKVSAQFDDPNLIGSAGLVPVMWLAERAGFHDHLARLSRSCPNAALKAAGVIAGMLAGADSIDGLDVLRHGGLGKVAAAVKAKAWFSVTARMQPAVTKAIAAIAEDTWTTIAYPRAVFGEAEQRWI